MKRKYLVFFILPAIFMLVFIPRNKLEVSAEYCSAKAMCVLDKDSNRILYAKNEHTQLPMASTTKVVTAITVLSHCQDLDSYVQVADESIGVDGTSIYLRKDEMIKVKDLLYGLMLRSGNDSAVALACHVAGNVENFANLMNEMAQSIGAKNSHFTNPHGLDDKEHYTTAYDLALITAYALNNPIFKEIVSTKSYVIDATNKSDKRYLTNKNKLLNSLDGCCGVKTGFTSKAGRCLVSACERDERTSVCVVLNCGPMFEESSALLESSFTDYERVKIIDKFSEIYNEYIIDKKSGKLYLYADEDFYYTLKKNELDDIKIEYSVKLDNAQEGDMVGEIRIFFTNRLIKSIKLYTMNKIDKLIDSKTLSISEILWEEKLNEN